MLDSQPAVQTERRAWLPSVKKYGCSLTRKTGSIHLHSRRVMRPFAKTVHSFSNLPETRSHRNQLSLYHHHRSLCTVVMCRLSGAGGDLHSQEGTAHIGLTFSAGLGVTLPVGGWGLPQVLSLGKGWQRELATEHQLREGTMLGFTRVIATHT